MVSLRTKVIAVNFLYSDVKNVNRLLLMNIYPGRLVFAISHSLAEESPPVPFVETGMVSQQIESFDSFAGHVAAYEIK